MDFSIFHGMALRTSPERYRSLLLYRWTLLSSPEKRVFELSLILKPLRSSWRACEMSKAWKPVPCAQVPRVPKGSEMPGCLAPGAPVGDRVDQEQKLRCQMAGLVQMNEPPALPSLKRLTVHRGHTVYEKTPCSPPFLLTLSPTPTPPAAPGKIPAWCMVLSYPCH